MVQGFGDPKNRLGLACLKVSDDNGMITNSKFHEKKVKAEMLSPNTTIKNMLFKIIYFMFSIII